MYVGVGNMHIEKQPPGVHSILLFELLFVVCMLLCNNLNKNEQKLIIILVKVTTFSIKKSPRAFICGKKFLIIISSNLKTHLHGSQAVGRCVKKIFKLKIEI